jgi:cysteinyl-tRNA synthetase
MIKAHNLHIYNSISRKKEKFIPLNEGFVGMYVCGPTVYNDVHIGNCRTFVNFDVINRYLKYLGYRVRYVRNITDVGHMLDDGEDRMLKGARLEQLEPMEVAQKYTNRFHQILGLFNSIPPSIEPLASGHIIDQIDMVKRILENGYAYESNGSVYFDTVKYAAETKMYGKLSGRKIEDLIAESRDDLKKQDEKKHPSDFAIWMKADPEHIMRWNSPWSVGFPGWHLECSVMSTKYLGETFDIHGGGTDLKFPHHENEIAQNVGSCNHAPVRYWMHANMLLMNGKKMSKSDGNTISPEELFTGNSVHVSKGYTPNMVRFFFIQSYYRSTLDLTDEALLASEKGYKRLMEGWHHLQEMATDVEEAGTLDEQWLSMIQSAFAELDDDFNTPRALARLFEFINALNTHVHDPSKGDTISVQALNEIRTSVSALIFDIFGLIDETKGSSQSADMLDDLMQLLIELRHEARANKDWATSDRIRDQLAEMHITLKDGADGTKWTLN